jgi:6-pyruvoyltetrahydropterin/6-carboxytetrahydropterin synthase
MSRQVWVFKRVSFDAAHKLDKHLGKCKQLHGHTYFVEVGVFCDIDEETGMGIDMADLGDWLKMNVGGLYDHRYLNAVVNPSTAENIAGVILNNAINAFGRPIRVRVFETPDSWVEIQGEPHGYKDEPVHAKERD